VKLFRDRHASVDHPSLSTQSEGQSDSTDENVKSAHASGFSLSKSRSRSKNLTTSLNVASPHKGLTKEGMLMRITFCGELLAATSSTPSMYLHTASQGLPSV